MTWEIFGEILSSNTVAVICGAILTAVFVFPQYKRQKVWENIEKRYFQEGIESLISHLNYLRTTIEENYANFSRIIRDFELSNSNDFKLWFSQNNITERKILSAKIPESFLITAFVLKNDSLNKICINIFAIAHDINKNLSIIPIFIDAISERLSIGQSKNEIVSKMREIAKEEYKEARDSGLYILIEVLESVYFELRKKNLNSYEDLAKVYESPEIQSILEQLKTIK